MLFSKNNLKKTQINKLSKQCNFVIQVLARLIFQKILIFFYKNLFKLPAFML